MQFTDLLLYFTYRQYTNLSTFQFVSEYCLRSTPCLYKLVLLNVFYLCLSLSQAIVAPRLFLRLEWYTHSPRSTHRLLYI